MTLKYKATKVRPEYSEYLVGICMQNVIEFLRDNGRKGYVVKHGMKEKKTIPEPYATIESPVGRYVLEISIDWNTVPGKGYWWFYLRDTRYNMNVEFGVMSMEWLFKTTMKGLLTKLELRDFEAA